MNFKCLFTRLHIHILEVVLQEFKKEFGGIPIKDMNVRKLMDFRKRFFGEPGTELNSCFIPEWKELPPKIARIKDEGLKLFALFLNRKWKDLCRQVQVFTIPRFICLEEAEYCLLFENQLDIRIRTFEIEESIYINI